MTRGRGLNRSGGGGRHQADGSIRAPSSTTSMTLHERYVSTFALVLYRCDLCSNLFSPDVCYFLVSEL